MVSEWPCFILVLCFTGTACAPRCTLRYAAPEVIAAHLSGGRVTVTAAADIWSLGLIAFELLSGQPAALSEAELYVCAAGGRQFPWEAEPAENGDGGEWARSRLRPVILACLARDPVERASVEALSAKLKAMYHHE